MGFQLRLNKIKLELISRKLDGVVISSSANITYLTGYSNFSNSEREAYLVITKNSNYIITDGRYSEAIVNQVPHFKLVELSLTNSITQILEKIIKKDSLLKIGIEEDHLTVKEYKKFNPLFKKQVDFNLNKIRIYKIKKEIENIKKACEIGDQTFSYIVKKLKIGISEKELASLMENFVKSKGAELSFPSIVGFGSNSSIPHHATGNTELTKKGQFVLLDFGVKYNNYCSDMTRTIFFGKASTRQKKIYETVLESQQKAIEYINSKLKKKEVFLAKEADRLVRDIILSKRFKPFSHSLGHGIGLEVHEPPTLSLKSEQVLENGMVFSIEPGIYIPGFGGVRIEDLFTIENSKLIKLTNSKNNLIEVV